VPGHAVSVVERDVNVNEPQKLSGGDGRTSVAGVTRTLVRRHAHQDRIVLIGATLHGSPILGTVVNHHYVIALELNEQRRQRSDIVIDGNDDVNVLSGERRIERRMHKSLLNEGSSKSFFASANASTGTPALNNGSRVTAQAKKTPGTASTDQVSINEHGVVVDAHHDALGQRYLRRGRNEWHGIAHVRSLSCVLRPYVAGEAE
jgi:hypothetical protein